MKRKKHCPAFSDIKKLNISYAVLPRTEGGLKEQKISKFKLLTNLLINVAVTVRAEKVLHTKLYIK